MSIIPKELTDEQLAEYFREYVDGCQCKERHTEAACNEVALYPGEPETYLYADTEGERLPVAGGNWNDGASAGVFSLDLNSARSDSHGDIGFRSAFYGKLDSEV